MSNSNIKDYFNSLFAVTVANTPSLKNEVYKIRYQVYCEELKYEPKENFPDQMEKDIFDERSIHILLKYKPTDSYIGCARIVLADQRQLTEPFPFEKICPHNVDFKKQPRKNFCEVSRLAVRGEFRRRKGEENTAQGLLIFDEKHPKGIEEKRIAPLIPMGIYLACTSITIRLNIVVFTIMEARLSRQLKIFDIPSRQIGDFVEFHGKRSPFLIYPEEVVKKMKPENRELFDSIDSSISQSLPYRTRNLKQNQLSPFESFNSLTAAYGLA